MSPSIPDARSLFGRPRRTAIVVLGAQRSGTSALTRTLSLLGACLPRNLFPAGVGNEAGHWEPEGAISLNDQILGLMESPVNDVHGPTDEWLQKPAVQACVGRIKDLIVQEYADEPLFVLKDPRISLLFPLWRAALTALNVRCAVVIIARNPLEVALSMARRHARTGDSQPWSLERGGLLWLRYNLAAERHARNVDRAFCEYSALLEDWRAVVRRLGEQLNISWPISISDAAPEIDRFLSRELRHHRETEDFRLRGGIWSAWIATVYSQLRGAAGGHAPDPAEFSAAEQAFDDVYKSVHRPPSPPAASRIRLRVMRRGRGERKICFVGNLFWDSVHGARGAKKAVDAAIAADSDISIVEIGAFTVADESAFADFANRHSFGIEYFDIVGPTINPRHLIPTIHLFRYLRAQAFDAILFQDRDGLGYASILAKRTGMAFDGAALAVVAAGSSGWIRQQERVFPLSLETIGTEYLEKMAFELADFAVLPFADFGRWMTEQGWRTRAPLSFGDAGFKDNWPRIIQQILQAAAVVQQSPPSGAADTTIIITHYEQPDLIEQNLQGLMQQTEKGFCVLVVDDGSKSGKARRYLETVEKRYQSLNLKLIRQENLYVGAARNAGIKAAATEFVILLDDDNVAFPDMVRTLRRAIRSWNADVVSFGLKFFHEENLPPNAAKHGNEAESYFVGGPILQGAIHNCFGDVSAIYRTDIFGKVGGFHEIHGVTYEDWHLHLRIAAAGFRILSLPEILLWYRVRKSSMLRSTSQYTNARVIASTVQALPGSALEPLCDYLMGTDLHQYNLNCEIERLVVRARLERAVTQAVIAAGSNVLTGETGRYVRGLQAGVEEWKRHAQALEGELARLRETKGAAPKRAWWFRKKSGSGPSQ